MLRRKDYTTNVLKTSIPQYFFKENLKKISTGFDNCDEVM